MKMKRLLPIILVALLLVPVAGWAAAYYVSKSGSHTEPYDSWEKAANDINSALAYIKSHGATNSILHIDSGIFDADTDYFVLNNSNLDGLIVIGQGDNTLVTPGGSYLNLITGPHDGVHVTFKNMHLKLNSNISGRIFVYADSTSSGEVTFKNCWLDLSPSNASAHIINVGSPDVILNINDCYLTTSKYPQTGEVFRIQGGELNLFYSTVMLPLDGNPSTSQIFIKSTGADVLIGNCVIITPYILLYLNNSSVNSKIYNSVLIGAVQSNENVIKVNNGTVDVYNSYLFHSFLNSDYLVSDNVELHNCHVDENPKITSPYSGYILARVDDYAHYDYALQVEAKLQKYGMKGTYFLETLYITDSSYPSWSDLQSMLQRGTLEIGAHSYSHVHFNIPDGAKIWDVVKESETISINHLEDKITTSDGLVINEYCRKSLADIKTILESNGWTITENTDVYPGKIHGNTLGECIADGTNINEIDLDNSRLYYSEMKRDCKDLYDTHLGNIIDPQTGEYYVANSFCFPSSTITENARDALIMYDYIDDCSFDVRNTGKAFDTLSEVDLFDIISYATGGGLRLHHSPENEGATRAHARVMGLILAYTGGVISLMTHDTSDLTINEWDWCLDEWSKIPNLIVTSHQLFAKYVRGNPAWEEDVDHIYRRAFGKKLSYRLSPHNSPCIDAGVKIAGIHDQADWQDLAGNMIHYGRAPDIGAYEAVTDVATAWGMLPWYGRKYCVRW